MKIAAIYDIHGNLPALEAVLNEIGNESVDLIMVGGDVVAGPMPRETLDALQNLAIPTRFIHGNAESEVLRFLETGIAGGLSPRADEEAAWVASVLSQEHKRFIAGWPLTVSIDTENFGEILFCHATPQNDIDVFTRMTPEETLLPLLGDLPASTVVCGHTHMQFDRTVENVRILKAGSVGMPFGTPGAAWLMIDSQIEFRTTDYDRGKAAERIRKSDNPHAASFAEKNVLQSPLESAALEMLAWIEAVQAKSRRG